MKILPVPTRVEDRQGKTWAAYTLKQAKLLLRYDTELDFLREQGIRLKKLRDAYIKQVRLLEYTCRLQDQQIDLLGRRVGEQTLRIEGLIQEKNHHKYKRSWALFGGKIHLGMALLIAAGGYAAAR